MRNFTIMLSTYALLLLPVGIVQAAILVDNTSTFSSTTASTTNTSTIYAGRFTTGSAPAWSLTSATANLDAFSTDLQFEASIWSSAGSLPDSQLSTFANNPTLAAGSGVTGVEFTSPGGITLASNTSYWLAIRTISGGYLGWPVTASPAPTQNLGWTLDQGFRAEKVGAGSWGTIDLGGGLTPWSLQFQLEGEAIPEPGSLAVLGLGAMGVGLIAWRRRKKGNHGKC